MAQLMSKNKVPLISKIFVLYFFIYNYIYYKAKLHYTYLIKQTESTLIKIYIGKYNKKIYKEYSVQDHNVIILEEDFNLLKDLDLTKSIMYAGVCNRDITKDINKMILYNNTEIKDMIKNIWDITETINIIDSEFNEINF
jgi:hypothetical protein